MTMMMMKTMIMVTTLVRMMMIMIMILSSISFGKKATLGVKFATATRNIRQVCIRNNIHIMTLLRRDDYSCD